MKKLYLLVSFVYSLALLLTNVDGFAQPGRVESEIEVIMAKYQAIGVAVAVVKDNEIIYNESFGLKNVASAVRLGNSDVFRIASISKSFVATGIMQLVETGKLSLDDDVSDLIGFQVRNPRFPDSVITLRMILSHTSSINDKNGYFTLDAFHPGKNPNWEQAYNHYAPGIGYQYCNLNFNLAGAILEKHSGERLDTYVSDHILKPLGLYGGYNVDDLDSARFVTLYAYNDSTKQFSASEAYRSPSEALKSYTPGYTTPVFSPTGGMKISAADLARYMTMHMNYGEYQGVHILAEESARAMQTAVGPSEVYGLAITSMDNLVSGTTFKGHTGSAYGLYSMMAFQPQEKIGFVAITNGCNTGYTDGLNNLLKEVINSLYKNFIQ